jgi:hypothetical protein
MNNQSTKLPQLTHIQREVLQSMARGAMLSLDKHNMVSLPDRPVQPVTRYFLTKHRLIVRADAAGQIKRGGCRFVISELGRAALNTAPRTPPAPVFVPASDAQISFAGNLGLKVCAATSMRGVSEILTRFDRTKHYFYGMLSRSLGRTAADLGIPRDDMEKLVARLVNRQSPIVDAIYSRVGPDESSSQFIKRGEAVFKDAADILTTEFSWCLERTEGGIKAKHDD